MRNILGGKGVGLHEMTRMRVPVPAGFTIGTDVCNAFQGQQGRYPRGLEREVAEALGRIEGHMGRRFGDPTDPLLVSVRSGARESMPGMMDSVLNLGLNDHTVYGLIARTQNSRFAYDTYRRFIQMYGDVVMGLRPDHGDERDPFEVILERKKERRGVRFDTELTAEDLQELVGEFKAEIRKKLAKDFPEDPHEQLWGAIGAVFGSWNNDRAIAYRELYHIPQNWGTAVNVQAMVFGNMGENCATGVVFTRNPATGEKQLYGEFLVNAQGEDVVAGIRTPRPIAELREVLPKAYGQLVRLCKILEKHYQEMLDLEFTIEDEKLWMLQTRAAKRTGFAAVRVAVDMVGERIISRRQAVLRIEPAHLTQLLQPIFDHKAKERAKEKGRVLASGLPAGPGAASGQLVFNAENAQEWKEQGRKVILCRDETSPKDIRGMEAAQGILTARGGMTSHAALIARQMGKVCVVGCEALGVDLANRELKVADKLLREGDWLSLDGTTGEIILGELETLPSEIARVLIEHSLDAKASRIYQQFSMLMKWADEVRRLGVRANADQPDQAEIARAFGAEGIGLCRTEHMFFSGDRINSVREMILAGDESGRQKALNKLLPMQKADFKGMLRVMGKLPVTVRTLDPPLHEFLPKTEREVEDLAQAISVPAQTLREKIENLQEVNPMLGHRGCRLGISFPEITQMQVRALFQAACELRQEGKDPYPEVMIPLVGSQEELHAQKEVVERTAQETMKAYGVKVRYMIGTMIELPRACMVADRIAQEAEFFSFGTNDLTQTTLGLSRDDAAKFLPRYLSQGILTQDPFVTIDREGVGALMRIAIEKAHKVRKKLELGVCGEHAGEPLSVHFFHDIGLDYVSCSPYRVPIAKLAAAQAALQNKS